MIELSGVSYRYGDTALLSDISLSLPAGSFHFLTGPSGSGKTTFLKLCYLELAPRSGTITVFGQDSRALDRDGIAATRQRIGIVHQDCQFLDHLSVAENISLPLLVSGRDPASVTADMKDLLAWVGLSGQSAARPPELSGGERQRAAVARAVSMAPDIILADDPTGNVDWEMSSRLMSLLVELNRMGRTVLMATHDLNLIRQTKSQIATRVLRIRDARLQLAGADL